MPRYGVSIPDAVWVATAVLHQKRPDCRTFSTREIRDCVIGLEMDCSKNPDSINDCITADCVAENPATSRSNNHRKLFIEGRGKYRLYRHGEDRPDPSKDGSPVEPAKHKLPPKFQGHLEWYDNVYMKKPLPAPSALGSPDSAVARAGRAAAGAPGGARTDGRGGCACGTEPALRGGTFGTGGRPAALGHRGCDAGRKGHGKSAQHEGIVHGQVPGMRVRDTSRGGSQVQRSPPPAPARTRRR